MTPLPSLHSPRLDSPKKISSPENEKGTQKSESGPKKMSKNSETESGIVYPEANGVADKLRALEMYGPNAETIRFLDSMWDAAMGVPPRNIEQKKSEPVGGKFFLILDETLMQYFRRPRSKKRRIRRKWRARAENYRPHPLVFEQKLMMGALAVANREQYERSQQFPVLKMHPATWAYVVAHNPGIEARAMIRTEHTHVWPRIPFSLQRKSP